MIAKYIISGAIMLCAATASQGAPCDTGRRMSAQQITQNVTGKYTCVGASPNATWNELLSKGSSGTVTDYKLGPSDPRDPSKQVGTFTVGGQNDNTSGGILTYLYTGDGTTYPYMIDTGTANGTLGASPYVFCQLSGGNPNGINFTVNVQAGPC